MSAWDLVIFDNDGVLVDSERLANRILAELLTEAGHPVTPDDCVRRFMGGTMARVRSLVEASGTTLPADLEDRYHRRLFDAMRVELRPTPGVAAALSRLDDLGTPCCVASSGTHERIRLSLATVGLLDRFDHARLFSADDVDRGKPAPDLFLAAAAGCGADPARSLVVEDSASGVTAGKAAGMTVVGYVGARPAPGFGATIGELARGDGARPSDAEAAAGTAVAEACDELTAAGADTVIVDMTDLVAVVDPASVGGPAADTRTGR